MRCSRQLLSQETKLFDLNSSAAATIVLRKGDISRITSYRPDSPKFGFEKKLKIDSKNSGIELDRTHTAITVKQRLSISVRLRRLIEDSSLSVSCKGIFSSSKGALSIICSSSSHNSSNPNGARILSAIQLLRFQSKYAIPIGTPMMITVKRVFKNNDVSSKYRENKDISCKYRGANQI
jgi:hypothetical protein